MVLIICLRSVTILRLNHWFRDFKSKTSSISSSMILRGILSSVCKKELELIRGGKPKFIGTNIQRKLPLLRTSWSSDAPTFIDSSSTLDGLGLLWKTLLNPSITPSTVLSKLSGIERTAWPTERTDVFNGLTRVSICWIKIQNGAWRSQTLTY